MGWGSVWGGGLLVLVLLPWDVAVTATVTVILLLESRRMRDSTPSPVVG